MGINYNSISRKFDSRICIKAAKLTHKNSAVAQPRSPPPIVLNKIYRPETDENIKNDTNKGTVLKMIPIKELY